MDISLNKLLTVLQNSESHKTPSESRCYLEIHVFRSHIFNDVT